jgi:[acyl-carrier-protein] S-malonyltransferase
MVAGHSVGEYSALVAAGALKLEDAIRITRLRGRLMESSCPAGLGGMAAIMGLEPEQVEKLFEGVPAGEIADIAAVNTLGQVVIAGHRSALVPIVEKAKAAGAMNATMLVVSGPFHSRLMQNARDGLSKALVDVKMNPTTLPVVTNADARAHHEPGEFRALLLDQLTKPVLWQATMARMVEQGITTFVELGAGRVLSGLLKKFDRKLICHSVRDPESLAKTIEALKADGYPVEDPGS